MIQFQVNQPPCADCCTHPPGIAPPPRLVFASPINRCVAMAPSPVPLIAPCLAPGETRGDCPLPHESHPQSTTAPLTTAFGRRPKSAADKMIPVSSPGCAVACEQWPGVSPPACRQCALRRARPRGSLRFSAALHGCPPAVPPGFYEYRCSTL